MISELCKQSDLDCLVCFVIVQVTTCCSVCTFTLQSTFSKTVMLNYFCALMHIVTIGSYYFRNVTGLLPNSIANIRYDLRKIHSFNIF